MLYLKYTWSNKRIFFWSMKLSYLERTMTDGLIFVEPRFAGIALGQKEKSFLICIFYNPQAYKPFTSTQFPMNRIP